MADNENVNNNENTDVVEELQNSNLLNNSTTPDYVNFYRGTRSDYEAKKEANQLDPNGMYFTVDEETGKRCIFIGDSKFSDINSGWEDSIVLSEEGVLQQVSKDSTDYNAHFQQLLEQINNVPTEEGGTYPYTLEELEIPAEEEAILNEHAKTYRYLMCYDTIADMRESRYLMVGMTAMVKGGSELNDGGAAFYNIRFRVDGEDVDNNSSLIILDNENVAEKINIYFSELRPANGNYVAQTNTTAANLTALDTQLKSITDSMSGLLSGNVVTYNAADIIDITETDDVSSVSGTVIKIGNHLVEWNVTFRVNSNYPDGNATLLGGHITEYSIVPPITANTENPVKNVPGLNAYSNAYIQSGNNGTNDYASIHITISSPKYTLINAPLTFSGMYWI